MGQPELGPRFQYDGHFTCVMVIQATCRVENYFFPVLQTKKNVYEPTFTTVIQFGMMFELVVAIYFGPICYFRGSGVCGTSAQMGVVNPICKNSRY